ncbi:PP2C family protein-serine/threonine phosphatase [Psychrobacter immobilis]|uniref:PP2C family protein-serine/threonine phosphatase n=1 Tax=Psychrobacter immobilis TaxID=498 RepID=UPI00191AC457|nr:protein phosphatase 2C domain-containing protein [Psychrobacter immobilis]
MTAARNNCPLKDTSSIAQACAITFQGTASNDLQQDAFFFLDNWYQEDLGVMAVTPVAVPFCLAVSDGVASSNHSQHCSKAVIKAIRRLWNDQKSVTSDDIHQLINQTKHSAKRNGAAATLAMVACELKGDGTIKATITHVGDSRIYWLPKGASQWQCLTRDHNLLNELIDQQVQEQGRQVEFSDYNREGMAGSLYSITECFTLTADDSYTSSEAPKGSSCNIKVNSGDCLLVCTDGIHDLVPSRHWQLVNAETDLQAWLISLKNQVYDSDGNAYDNGTAILVRFD